MGGYPPPPGASDIPGLEIAGEVVALGPGASQWRVGDRVTALVTGGGYAEYCPAPAAQCLPVPKDLDFLQAAAIPETWFTVWSNLVDRGRLQKGESLLIHGGASGIGTAAIQLARELGATIYATAGTDEKCRQCEALGAKRGINYKTEDFVEVVKAATGGQGVQLVLDMVAGSYVDRNLAVLQPDGRLVIIALLGGPQAQVNVAQIMLKRLTVTGSTLRIRPVAFKAAIAEALGRTVWPWFEAGRVKPIIDSSFPLREAAKAHARLDAADHVGKIMLTT
jgi:NADPH:quinone reductase